MLHVAPALLLTRLPGVHAATHVWQNGGIREQGQVLVQDHVPKVKVCRWGWSMRRAWGGTAWSSWHVHDPYSTL